MDRKERPDDFGDVFIHNSIDDDFDDLSESLKQQVNEELDGVSSEEEEKVNEGEIAVNRKRRRKKKKGLKIFVSVVLVICLLLAFFIGTKPGRSVLYKIGGDYLANRLDNTDDDGKNDLFAIDEEETYAGRKEDYVVNILLIGIEEIAGGQRSDSMMIASVNKYSNTIKLVSVMRDCYVSIPGHNNNKLNAAFAKGGADLLIAAIEENFDVHIDGYASVNFESFEKIIDRLGGVDIELGAAEAKYLNKTNYISNPEYRNVKEGMNHLNGNQALGYSRVRKVETLGGANSDFGRTLRQRRVLNALFDKYKSKGVVELFSIMNDVLPLVKTDLNSKEISTLIETVMENHMFTIENSRIPAEGMYTGVRNECGAVLQLDFEANIAKLHEILYTPDAPETTEETTNQQ